MASLQSMARGERIAVLELIDKIGPNGTVFTKEDEETAAALCSLASISIAKASVYQGLKDCATRIDGFLDVLADPDSQRRDDLSMMDED